MLAYDIEDIQKLRKKIGLTQSELARKAGVSQSLIAKIESERVDPAYSKVKAIINALENELITQKSDKTAADIMTAHPIFVRRSDSLDKVMKIMKEKGISQLPVFEANECVGSVSDDMLVDWITRYGTGISKAKVSGAMKEAFPVLPKNADMETIATLLKAYKAVLIKHGGVIRGIVTKADLINAIK